MLDLVLPTVCEECRARSVYRVRTADDAPAHIPRVLCATCVGRLSFMENPGCTHCQRKLATSQAPRRCTACMRERTALGSCTAQVAFTGNAEKWIHAFKYPHQGIAGLDPAPIAIAKALARDAAQTSPAPFPDVVVPVPLHVRRLRSRGFNPASQLARAIAKQTTSGLVTDLLLRHRDTPTQTNLGRNARRKNVRGAFSCTRNAPDNVWLVDDVVTTGSTLEEAARCLKAAGAKSVHAICIARTPERFR
ncbi:MAG TPA: ComF family protein [Myxococcales bacterium]|nr:ComF family protein [Myxococcales bacterium]